jgi:hypothetical protein
MWICVYPRSSTDDIGKEVVPGPGSVITDRVGGRFGLFLDPSGEYVPMKLVKNGAAADEVRKFGIPWYPAARDDGVDGAPVPVGFRDDDEPVRGSGPPVVDLRRLAGEEPDAAAGGRDGRESGGVWRHATRPEPKPAAKEPSEAGSDALRPPDLRVLYVDTDDTDTRYKEWRKVVLESKTVTYSDVPLDGPLSALNWCRHTHRFGGNPRLWFNEFARSKSIQSTDRVYHELSTLVDAIYHAGTYDQYNVGCSICVEVLARRIQSIVDAYSNPGRIDFTQARLFVGTSSLEDAIDPALRNYVARRSKDEAEIQNAREKARALAGPATPAAGGGAAQTGAPGPTRPKRAARKKAGEGAGAS